MGMISSALGGISSNFTSIATADRRAKQVKSQYETQARLAEYNRQIAENQRTQMEQMQKHQLQMADLEAKQAENKAHQKILESADNSTALQERNLAIMAKSGVTSAGTPILVAEDAVADALQKQNDIKYKTDMGIGKMRHNYELSAWNYGNKATMFDSRAKMAQYQANVARSVGKYRSKMIKFQKKLTIAKMFYDGANVTSFGEVDNPQQYQHFNTSTLSSLSSWGDSSKSGISNGYSSSSKNASVGGDSAGSSLLVNKGGKRYA